MAKRSKNKKKFTKTHKRIAVTSAGVVAGGIAAHQGYKHRDKISRGIYHAGAVVSGTGF